MPVIFDVNVTVPFAAVAVTKAAPSPLIAEARAEAMLAGVLPLPKET